MEGGADDGRLSEIAVVGAGVAGAALAIACRRNGQAVRLYDRRAETERDATRLLELTANGTRVLHAIGLKDALGRIGRFPSFATVRNSRTGFLLGQRPLGPFSEARYGAPCCLVRAEDLRAMLLDAARREGITVEAPVTVTDVDTETGTLSLRDGRRTEHLAVAVATGRPGEAGTPELDALLEPRQWAIPRTPTLIRARSWRSTPDREHGRFLTTWLGSGFVIVERPDTDPQGSRQPVELLVVQTTPREDRCATETCRALLAGCHPHLAGLAESLEARHEAVPVADVARHWQAGRAVLLGSACHAAPAYPELEPSAALEDAWILSRMMERWEDEPHQGFADYERFRRARATRLRTFAESELAVQTLPAGASRWQRDIRWSLSSRFLPEIALEKLDWLYGYDCIRGFA
ncbi:MAG: FAD-dependent oxidoreductase [Pseudomonadales bacterium]